MAICLEKSLAHGGVVTGKVVDVNHRRSPLIQEGLGIPIVVSVVMEDTDENKQAIDIYETLINKHYKEPVDGEFEGANTVILERIRSDTQESETDTEG